MAHSLFRLYESLYNTPHLITQTSLDPILDYLENRNTIELQVKNSSPKYINPTPQKSDSGVGLINIHGSLSYKPMASMCGEARTSYVGIEEQAEQLIAIGVKTIVFDFDSGGGEASHAFEYSNDLRKLTDDNGVRTIAYIDKIAASAAYAYACQCNEVIINPSASAGSIGCVIALMNNSKQLAANGIERKYITSGKNKVPFDNDGSFKEEFIDKLQSEVDRLNLEFANHVSKYTGLSVEDINNMEADVFNAEEALEKGLVNKIMTTKQFAAYIAELHKG